MIVSIHQPQYLPWLGYFEKMDRADVFVFLDDVQFTKNDWQNRNKIRTAEGWHWLTVPVLHRFGQAINETQTDERSPWRQKHGRSLELNYKKAPYYAELEPELSRVCDENDTNLSSLCLRLIEVLTGKLGLTTRTAKSSDLKLSMGPNEGIRQTDPVGPSDRSERSERPIRSVQATDAIGQPDRSHGKELATKRLVEICKYFQADTYYAGAHGRHYMDLKVFNQEKIEVVFQDYRHPTYRQCFNPFIPNMSVVDLLFNEGPGALEIIRSGIRGQGSGVGSGEKK